MAKRARSFNAGLHKRSSGHVYVLASDNCGFVKIGGTDYAPMKRLREVNAAEPYKTHGPWRLHDFRQVSNWCDVEYEIHYGLRSNLVRSVGGQKELFSISAPAASRALSRINPDLLTGKPKVDRLFNDETFAMFLGELFRQSALLNWLDTQGAWTLSLFPSTSGGRFYTINIGRHEVAFATSERGDEPSTHTVVMDVWYVSVPTSNAG